MTDLANNIENMHEEELEYKDPQGRIIEKMGKNINALIDNATDKGFLGEVKQSILSEAQFQARRGTSWVIMAGQDITGSDYHTTYSVSTLPNMLGKFPRVWTNAGSVDSGRAIGSDQVNANVEHRHRIFVNGGATGALYQTLTGGFQNSGLAVGETNAFTFSSLEPDIAKTNNKGETEARPSNYSVNYFIRINS